MFYVGYVCVGGNDRCLVSVRPRRTASAGCSRYGAGVFRMRSYGVARVVHAVRRGVQAPWRIFVVDFGIRPDPVLLHYVVCIRLDMREGHRHSHRSFLPGS